MLTSFLEPTERQLTLLAASNSKWRMHLTASLMRMSLLLPAWHSRSSWSLDATPLAFSWMTRRYTRLIWVLRQLLKLFQPYIEIYHTFRILLAHKIHPCLSTNFVSEATMVVSGFGPYHHLVHDDAPTEHAGVILTPWAMPFALGLGTIHLGGDWHLVPSPPCICSIYGEPAIARFTMNMYL